MASVGLSLVSFSRWKKTIIPNTFLSESSGTQFIVVNVIHFNAYDLSHKEKWKVIRENKRITLLPFYLL